MTTTPRGAGLSRLTAGAVLALASAGCSDSSHRTDPELTHALRGHLDGANPPCLRLVFPLAITPERSDLKAPLRALVRAGFLVERDAIQEQVLSRTGRLWMPVPTFELTERGRRHYREGSPGGARGLCL